MIGENTFELNQATMCEAIQEYLNKRMGVYAPKVRNVTYHSNACDSYFKVLTSEKETEET